MSKAAGVVLILGGLGLAAFATSSEYAMRGSGASRQGEQANIDRMEAKVVEPVAVPRPQPVRRTATAPRTEAAPPGSAPVVVTLAPRSGDAAPSRAAAIPRDRDSLARELQKELRRVGCYEGELNGVWTPATRRAMKTFTDRVNATLPVDEPDAVLYVMVQSQQERVCGKPCPVDQGLSEDGRCVPNAILAKAARSAVATHVPASGGSAGKPLPARSWSATVTATRPTPPAVGAPAALTPPQALPVIQPAPATPLPTEGRMALAGPTPQQAPAGATPAPGASAPAGALATPRPPLPPAKRGVQANESWTRMMNARRFDSPN
jgi:hypothetical protein